MPQNLQQLKLIYICVNQIKMSLPQKRNYNQNITHKKNQPQCFIKFDMCRVYL